MPREAEPFTPFVSAVDEVNDHIGSILDIMESRGLSKHCRVRRSLLRGFVWLSGGASEHRKIDICKAGTDYSLWTQIVVT